jgi:hypothetical protein
MTMIGAPAWMFGPAQHPSFVAPIPHVTPGAFSGLGLTRARWTAPPSGLGLTRARWSSNPHLSRAEQLQGITEFFDSPMWKYRKWFVLGGVALVGLAALSLAGAILR